MVAGRLDERWAAQHLELHALLLKMRLQPGLLTLQIIQLPLLGMEHRAPEVDKEPFDQPDGRRQNKQVIDLKR